MAEVERSKSMWANVDGAMVRMGNILEEVMPAAHAHLFLAELETLITELVKAPPRGKTHPSRVKT